MVNFNKAEKIKDINFLLGSCKYHLSRIKEEKDRLCQAFKINNEELLRQLKSQKKTEAMIVLEPFEFRFDRGKAALIYEFNAFVTDLITCVNYATDLKLRTLDGYSRQRSITIGQYNDSQRHVKYIKNRGKPHQILVDNYQRWIKPVNDVRNRIIHSFIVVKLIGKLYVEARLTSVDKGVIAKECVFTFPQFKIDSDIFQYCQGNFKRLNKFIKSIKQEV